MLTRKQIVLVKTETTYGEDASPDGSNRMYVTELEPSYYEGDRQTRERLREHLGGRAEINTGPYATLQITVPLAGSGVAGLAPVFGPLLRASALQEAVEEGVEVRYTPISDNFESCTIYYLQDGVQQKITGARGTFTMECQRGQFPTLQFTMTGKYERPTAASAVTPSTIEQADELPVNNQNTAAFSVHGHAGCGESLSVELGNEVAYRNLIGCEKAHISDRNTAGQINVEAPTIGTKNYFQAVESHEELTLAPVIFEHGKEAGNIVRFEAPKTQLSSISNQDSDGIVHYQMDAQFLPDEGNDEFTLTFK